MNLKIDTTNIKNLINLNYFIENEDYLIRNVSDQVSSGSKYKNEYYLHPDAVKICLIISLKTKNMQNIIYYYKN